MVNACHGNWSAVISYYYPHHVTVSRTQHSVLFLHLRAFQTVLIWRFLCTKVSGFACNCIPSFQSELIGVIDGAELRSFVSAFLCWIAKIISHMWVVQMDSLMMSYTCCFAVLLPCSSIQVCKKCSVLTKSPLITAVAFLTNNWR